MLRYQINPHFLFNTMNSLLALVNSNNNQKAKEMILQLSDFLRYSLSDELIQQVSLEKEIEALKKYLLIEQTRFGNRLKTEIKIEESAKSCSIPSLLLQPLIENAIKYAIAPSESGGTIYISAKKSDDFISISVEDSGSDGDNNLKLESMGLGLKNIENRLNTLYPNKYKLRFGHSHRGGAQVTIDIPAHSLSKNSQAEENSRLN
jgi:LytS/YehU family sensor histidine kinase